MKGEKINWGIIGLGKVSHKFASDLMLSEGALLKAVASRTMEKAEEFGNKFNAEKKYGAYEALAKDPEVDIVYIATPHVFHFENTLMCLENGKSVLCEKPIGMNEEQVKTLFEKAQSKKLFLMEGIWTRFFPSFRKVLEIIESGQIGEVLFVRADFGFKAENNPKGRLLKKSLGGGSLLDIGLYPVYLSLLALGKPDLIKALARKNQEGVDTYTSMLFDYKNGSKAILESTFEADTPIEAYIYGTLGSIKINSPFHHSPKITLNLNGKEAQIFDFEIKGYGYYYEIEAVNEYLEKGLKESPEIPFQTSLEMAEILARVRKEIKLEY